MAAKRILVIGAGPSGLVALKTFRCRGLDAVSYEMSPVLGGQWVIDNPSGQSSAYESLETNTTKKMSRLSDYGFDGDENEFVSRPELIRWWQEYADHFGLTEHIRFGRKVLSLVPDPAGWSVVSGPDSHTERFSAVVIATGNYWDPLRLDIPGHFDGQRIHASSYRSPRRPIDLSGKKVVVIGPGSTGCEIAAEAAVIAESVVLSARSGVNIGPKYIDGVAAAAGVRFLHPLDSLPPWLERMPEKVRRRLYYHYSGLRAWRSRRSGGFNYQDVGLPPPPHPLAKRTSSSQAIFAHFASGQVRGCGEIARLHGGEVELLDGGRLAADVIIEATGYHMTFPYLSSEILDTTGDDVSLYRRIMHPERNDLFVVGIARPVGSFWTMAEAQSVWIAEHLSGRSGWPTERERHTHTEPVMGTAMLPAFYGSELRADARRRRT